MLRLLLAEDHEIVRRGLRSLIALAHPGWEVIAETGNGQQALDLALRNPPDVAVVDVQLPGLDGVELTRELKVQRPEVRVLLLTVYDDEDTVRRGLEAGARGYLVKSDGERELEAAIAALGANRTYFSAMVSELLLAVGSGRTPKTLRELVSPREREVMRLMALGKSNRTIAASLGVSLKTVESHRSSAMRKLNVATGAALVRAGIKNKIIEG